jgi:hypothetical protein
MLPQMLKVQDIKTGKIREITEYAHKINQKHGNDKNYMVLPQIDEVKVQEIVEKQPEPIPTYDPYTDEITMDEFEEAEINPTDEYGYKISDSINTEPIKKKKRGRKPKNTDNE